MRPPVGQAGLDLAQALLEVGLAAVEVVLAGVVGAVGQPHAEQVAARRLHDVGAGQHVVDRLAPHPRVRVA